MKIPIKFVRATLALAAMLVLTSLAQAGWTVGDMIRARRATAEHVLRNRIPRQVSRQEVKSYVAIVRDMTMLLELLPDEVLDIEMVPVTDPEGPVPVTPGTLKPADGSSIPWYGPDFVGPIIRK